MENSLITGNPDSKDKNQSSDQTQSLDQKDASPLLKIVAEKREGEDFPSLEFYSSVFMKNNIVLFGGRASTWKKNNVFRIYNLETRTWSQKELKGQLSEDSNIQTSNEIVVRATNILIKKLKEGQIQCSEFDFESEKLIQKLEYENKQKIEINQQIQSKEIPKPRNSHTANTIGHFIYIIGGYGADKDEKVYKIDFDTQKCQIIGKITNPVASHTADTHNQSIYIFGGKSTVHGKLARMLQKFNLLTNQCELIKPIGYQPKRRCGHKSIIVQDNLYVFGGSDYPKFFQDMFTIDLSSMEFTKIYQHGSIPSPRSSFSFFAFEDKLYLFGGKSRDETYSDFYSFDIKSSSWKPQQTKNQKCLLERANNSTVTVKESSCRLKVYLVGGKGNYYSFQKNMNVLTFSSCRIYWVLHYLDCTGIHYLPGLNLVQEIIEMFE